MKKKCIVVRALPLERDSRTQRYKDYFKDDYDVEFNSWESDYTDKKRGIERLKISREKNPLLLAYILYLLYLFLFSLFKIKKGDIVIAMDLDTFVPIKCAQLIKRFEIIFDIVDPISQTRFRKLSLYNLFDKIEYCIIKSDIKVIIPSKFRINYYEDVLNKGAIGYENVYVCENVIVPHFSGVKNKKFSVLEKTKKHRIGYFGSLDDTRGIIELINYIINFTDLEIIVAGRGGLDKKLKEIKHKQFQFVGSYSADDLNELYDYVDFVWAYYSPDVLLHYYAAPNKFYEHLAFKTPIILNSCVPQSLYITNSHSGIVINNHLDDSVFSQLVDDINMFDVKKSDFSDWENNYSNYEFSIHN